MNREIKQALTVCNATIDELTDNIISEFETYKKALRYVNEQKAYASSRLHAELLNEITSRINDKALEHLTKAQNC